MNDANRGFEENLNDFKIQSTEFLLTVKRFSVDIMSCYFFPNFFFFFHQTRTCEIKIYVKRNYPFSFMKMFLCVHAVHADTRTSVAYEEPPLTSFSLGFSLVELMGFLFRIPRSRVPRSRCAFGGAPLADVLVVFAEAVGAADCCCAGV